MNRFLKILFQIGLVLLIGGFAISVTSWVTKEQSKEEIVKSVVEEIILKKPSCPDTLDSFQELKNSGQVVYLARDLNTYGNGTFDKEKFTVVKSAESGSQIACGYLYVRGRIGNRELHKEWGEHPYIKPGQFGGHIDVEKRIMENIVDGKTEWLFNLSEINYWSNSKDLEKRQADWSALLNVSNKIQFEIALNTTNHAGYLDEVSIVYQCWSPETGQVTHDCELSVE